MSASKPSTAPIVFVFGFHRSRERIFTPLKAFYQRLTPHVVVHVPRMFARDFSRTTDDGSEFMNKEFYPLISAHPEAPIMFHCFSMNGTCLLFNIWKKLSTGERKRVKGLVFDSAPTRHKTYPIDHLNTMFLAYPKAEQTMFNYIFWHIPTALPTSLARSFKVLIGAVEQSADLLFSMDLPHNQLYLTSKKDNVILCESVKEYVDHQVAKGRSVEFKLFETGEHCRYFLEDDTKEEYFLICQRFFERVFLVKVEEKPKL